MSWREKSVQSLLNCDVERPQVYKERRYKVHTHYSELNNKKDQSRYIKRREELKFGIKKGKANKGKADFTKKKRNGGKEERTHIKLS